MPGQQKTAKRWFVSGAVQGVGFRVFVQNKATTLGICGWAQNLDDGRVEVYAVGKPESLQNLAASLHVGPRMSEVRGVEERDAPVESCFHFTVR